MILAADSGKGKEEGEKEKRKKSNQINAVV